MRRKDCIAMLLAGGQGSRLGALTRRIAKPAVSFGGKYRIIDFSLSNCINSNIDTVGVLTQYRPLMLNSYIGTGAAWDLDEQEGGVFVLPPYATESGAQWYAGTADAVYKNMDFIENYEPEHVLIISGDHLYKMDYNAMLNYHKQSGAELTAARSCLALFLAFWHWYWWS
ncbi:MAG: NTP transferase domain-containing protein [Firmicutes bacterium]|nr:NTP transferase domain-containing protein [Bacillota bacterium]